MKRTLKIILLLLAAVGVAFATYPFIKSIGPSEDSVNRSLVSISIPQLVTGVPVKIKIGIVPLIILKPSHSQISSIKALDTMVWDSTIYAYNNDLKAYVYWGVSTRFGCELQHMPPRTIEGAEWLGGYWDDSCEVSYDYAGRAIKDYSHTYNGYTRKYPNLKTPTVFAKEGDHYNVSIYQR